MEKKIGVPAAQPPSVGSNNKFGNPLFQDFTDSDFHGFEWISPANFTGIELIGGRKCLVFKTTATYLGITYPEVAATDFETRLPVQLQGYGEITVYRFQQVADGSQSLPDAVQKYFNTLPQAAATSAPAPY